MNLYCKIKGSRVLATRARYYADEKLTKSRHTLSSEKTDELDWNVNVKSGRAAKAGCRIT